MIPIEIILGVSALILAVAGIAQIRFTGPKGNAQKVDVNFARDKALKLSQALYAVGRSDDQAYFAKGLPAVLNEFGRYQKVLGDAAKYARYKAGAIQKRLGQIYQKYIQNFKREYARPIMEEASSWDTASKEIGMVLGEASQMSIAAEAYGKGVIPVGQAQALSKQILSHYGQEYRINSQLNDLRSRMSLK